MNRKNHFKSILVIISIMLFSSFLFAQSGKLSGKITDNKGGALSGANIIVQGENIGVATDIEGNFLLRNVPSGNQTVKVSYIGYQTKRQEVTVKPDETVNLDIVLLPKSVKGEEVEITAQASGELSSINQQISSDNIKNVISAERIRELPDADAATAVSRLPGVSLDGDKVVIRGVQPKMNNVTINGVSVPASTGSRDQHQGRSFNLGLISSNMLSGIDLTKAVTPDMDANATGGTINLRSSEAPEDFEADISVSNTYNNQVQSLNNYKIWASVSNRFFDNMLGIQARLNYGESESGSDGIYTGYERAAKEDEEVGNRSYALNKVAYEEQLYDNRSFGYKLTLDYKWDNGKLIFNSFHTENENKTTKNQQEAGFGSNNFHAIRLNYSEHTKTLDLHNLRGKHEFDFMDVDYTLAYTDVEKDGGLNFGIPFRSTGEEFDLYKDGSGAHDNSVLRQISPWDAWDRFINDDANLLKSKIKVLNAWPIDLKEDRYVGEINFDVPFRVGDLMEGTVEFGGKYTYSDRVYDEDKYTWSFTTDDSPKLLKDYANILSDYGIDSLGTPRLRDWYKPGYSTTNFLGGKGENSPSYAINKELAKRYVSASMKDDNVTNLSMAASFANDYEGTEELKAGYLMTKINIGDFRFIPGFRYEKMNTDYLAYKVITENLSRGLETERTAQRENVELLPALHAKYEATDWLDLKFAYTNTLTRPDYKKYKPSVSFTQKTKQANVGNPDLDPARSINYDLFATIHSDKIGLISLGGYQKTMKDVFYSADRIVSDTATANKYDLPLTKGANFAKNGKLSSYINNPYDGWVRGLELEWRATFWYLPGKWKNIIFTANYSRIWSEMDYPIERREISPFGSPDTTSKIRSARMIQQAKQVGNIVLGYQEKGFTGRLSFRFRGNVLSSVATVDPEEDTFKPKSYNWDLTLRQNLPIEGLRLFFNIHNITNTPSETIIHNRTNWYNRSGRRYETKLQYGF